MGQRDTIFYNTQIDIFRAFTNFSKTAFENILIPHSKIDPLITDCFGPYFLSNQFDLIIFISESYLGNSGLVNELIK